MAAELVAQLRGGAPEREAAYVELLRLEAAHNASASAPAATREELRGLKLTQLRARALAAELDEAAVDSAMDADAPKAALVELLLARRPSEEEKYITEIAVACASPLCEVQCRPIMEVGVAEWQRAALVLAALSGVAPARVGGECTKPDQCNMWQPFMTPESALGVLLTKEPAALTLEDALTAACAWTPLAVHYSTSTGQDAPIKAAGLTSTEWLGMAIPNYFMIIPGEPRDDRNLVLVPLLLELLKAPEKLPEFALSEPTAVRLFTLSPRVLIQSFCSPLVLQPGYSGHWVTASSVDPPSLRSCWSWTPSTC